MEILWQAQSSQKLAINSLEMLTHSAVFQILFSLCSPMSNSRFMLNVFAIAVLSSFSGKWFSLQLLRICCNINLILFKSLSTTNLYSLKSFSSQGRVSPIVFCGTKLLWIRFMHGLHEFSSLKLPLILNVSNSFSRSSILAYSSEVE